MKKLSIVALCAITLVGCAAPPSIQELSAADYGPEPVDYQATVKSHMNLVLKDPESARYDFYKTPVKGYSGNPRQFGWVTCFNVNAKNSYGGYTGMQKHLVLIRYDSVVHMLSSDGTNGIMDGIVAQSCANI